VWSNFEFVADNGSIYEVDMLCVGLWGAFLVEIKSRHHFRQRRPLVLASRRVFPHSTRCCSPIGNVRPCAPCWSLQAITLFDVASTAKQKNQKIGILDQDDKVVKEIVGI
jgi:hypothetical protein